MKRVSTHSTNNKLVLGALLIVVIQACSEPYGNQSVEGLLDATVTDTSQDTIDIQDADIAGDCLLACSGTCVSDASWIWADDSIIGALIKWGVNRFNLSSEFYAHRGCCPAVDYSKKEPVCARFRGDDRCRFTFQNLEEYGCLTEGSTDWAEAAPSYCQCDCSRTGLDSCCAVSPFGPERQENDCPYPVHE